MSWPDTKAIIAVIVMVCTVGMISVLLIHPPAIQDSAILSMLNMVLGGWIAYGTTIVQFYFGSSQGSQVKDDTIGKLAGK